MFLRTLNETLLKVAKFIIVALMGVMTVLVFAGVLARYVFQVQFAWGQELARFAMIWVSFLGAAVASHRGVHAEVTFILERVSPRMRNLLNVVNFLIISTVLFCLGWYGAVQAWANRLQFSPTLRVSMSYPYAAIPVGSLLMFLFTIEAVITKIKPDKKRTRRE
jgi:TRAP-type C4-dicarboxylate transport system permease small subunit